MIPSKASVIRDGKTEVIPAADLVLGDIVVAKMGDKTPADILLFSCSDMKVDNASLTGESEAQDRKVANSFENPLEASNLSFNGSLVVNGEGFGIVVRTGDKTVIGQIASLTNNEKKQISPMAHEIGGWIMRLRLSHKGIPYGVLPAEQFVYKIAAIAMVFAIVFFLIGLLGKKSGIAFSLNFAIGILVAFVPQGLPSTVTMLLSIAARRMAAKNVLVKDLQGVETLGALTLLATDKTGTLTKNQMTVTYLWTGKILYSTELTAGIGPDKEDIIFLDKDAPGVNAFLLLSALCSKARFDRTDVPVKDRMIIADATESGLYRCAAQRLSDFDSVASKYPKVFEVPFNSTNKWAMTIHKLPHAEGPLTLMMKGAPERVLKLCTKIFDGENGEGVVRLIRDEDKEQFEIMYRFMASKGHRVLAFATDELEGSTFPEDFAFNRDPANYPMDNLIFQGLVSLEDPPKHGVREAVGKIRQAGIQVVMVTGEHRMKRAFILLRLTHSLCSKRGPPFNRGGNRAKDQLDGRRDQGDGC
jgi:sodium/potassium-transporting ATPase subunit alpha